MKLKQWTTGAMVGVGMVGLAGMGVSAPAQASTSTSQVQLSTSGEFQCGPNNWVGNLVPESPWGGANFHPACLKHDACYNQVSYTNRYDCDVAFRYNMYAACSAAGKGATCRGVASTYYYAVRDFGRWFYKGHGLNN